jgi:transposase
MSHNVGKDRSQSTMLPECLDDFVSAGNPVRIIEKVVSSLDLRALGFKYAVSADTGRPPYDPADLLKLYIYGYLNGINSGRDLEKLCRINLEVMWLVRRVTPDFRTICAFRRNNPEAIHGAMVKFNKLWCKLGLIGSDTVAIDSSKFRAVNSKDNNYSEKKLNQLLQHYERRIAEYLQKLEEADRRQQSNEEKDFTAAEMEEMERKLEIFKQRQQEHSERLAALKETGEKQVSTVDPDSRRMRSNDGTVVGYSAQVTIDSKNKMILDFEVNNAGNDTQQFEEMALRAKELLKVEKLKVAADTGYFKAEAIINCEKAGIETHVSVPSPPTKNPHLFEKKDFIYNVENDLYICPANQKLIFKGMISEHGRSLRRYEPVAANTCRYCPLRTQCTTRKKRNRRVTRFIDECILEKAVQRNEASPDLRSLRKSMVEHPFGTIKCRINHGRFLTKGRIKVRTEFALAVIAYNFKRVFSLLPDLLLTLLTLGPFYHPKTHPTSFFFHLRSVWRKTFNCFTDMTHFRLERQWS